MLTVLTVEDIKDSLFRKKPFCFLPSNRLSVSEKISGTISVRHIHYINRNGKISYDKINRKAKEGRENIVYSGQEELDTSKLSFLNPTDFRARLCANMAIACLQAIKKKTVSIKIGIYDPKGDAPDLAEHFLKLTDKLVVVTDNIRLYETEAQRLMWERGAPFTLSRKIESLSRCKLIVAPAPIRKSFSPQSDSIVLTCAEPSVSLSCRVYYKYDFRLPPALGALKPEGVSTEIFAAGLYSIYKIYPLGNTVPLVCSQNTSVETYLSLGRLLEDTMNT